MAMERRMPAKENSIEDLLKNMLANRTAELVKQEEETARVGDEAGLVPDEDKAAPEAPAQDGAPVDNPSD